VSITKFVFVVELMYSKFGLAFQQAAEESGAGAKHDMFDTSVVEVRQEDLMAFVECLQLQSS
jgi:cell division control protein 45